MKGKTKIPTIEQKTKKKINENQRKIKRISNLQPSQVIHERNLEGGGLPNILDIGGRQRGIHSRLPQHNHVTQVPHGAHRGPIRISDPEGGRPEVPRAKVRPVQQHRVLGPRVKAPDKAVSRQILQVVNIRGCQRRIDSRAPVQVLQQA